MLASGMSGADTNRDLISVPTSPFNSRFGLPSRPGPPKITYLQNALACGGKMPKRSPVVTPEAIILKLCGQELFHLLQKKVVVGVGRTCHRMLQAASGCYRLLQAATSILVKAGQFRANSSANHDFYWDLRTPSRRAKSG